jgi:hypothetical protein
MNATDDPLWSYLPKLYISKFGDDNYILKTTVIKSIAFPLLNTIPEFYREVIYSYNTSKIIDYEQFYQNIKTQPIWGNKFLTFKNKTLFFKPWIKAGIMKIENLKLANGRLDANYLSNLVQDDRNFYSEINILQTALRNINMLDSIEPANDVTLPKYIFHADEYYKWECIQAKYYYVHIIEHIRANPTTEQYWINIMHISQPLIFMKPMYVK